MIYLVAALLVSDVKALWRDQDQEGAFRGYVEVLEKAEIIPTPPMSQEEAAAYEEALSSYLKHVPLTTEGRADWYRVGFLLAAAEANRGEFESFFDRFYASYVHDPGHFLAFKTQAILHIKLFERAREEGERRRQRELVMMNLKRAEELYPADFSLYTMQIAFAAPEEKQANTREVLNKILKGEIIPSRSDTLQFLKIAESTKEKELIDSCFKKANQWYPDSRMIKLLQAKYDGHENTR